MRKLSKRDNKRDLIIEQIRETVKSDPIIIEKFKEYGIPLSKIDEIPISFAKIDTSARTKNKQIYLNELMLSEKHDVDPVSYVVHELVHYLQQLTNFDLEAEADDAYLEKPSELEAFDAQIDYKKRTEDEEEVEEYVEDLVEHHGMPISSRDGKKKVNELLGD